MTERRAEIQPELWVGDGAAAVAFYERALGAVVEHRVGGPDDTDIVAQLSVAGARFWVATASKPMGRLEPAARSRPPRASASSRSGRTASTCSRASRS